MDDPTKGLPSAWYEKVVLRLVFASCLPLFHALTYRKIRERRLVQRTQVPRRLEIQKVFPPASVGQAPHTNVHPDAVAQAYQK